MRSTERILRIVGFLGFALCVGLGLAWVTDHPKAQGSSFSLAPNPSISVINSNMTGTTLNTLTKFGTAQPTVAVIAVTTDVMGVVGITTANAGITGFATITTSGLVSCIFDGATTANDYIQISKTVNGDCHDSGSIFLPLPGQVIGRVLTTNASGGTYIIDLFAPEVAYGINGSVNNAFCTGVINNLGTVVLYPLQTVTTTCASATSFPGPYSPTGSIQHLQAKGISANSNTAGSGVVTLFVDGLSTALTCTLGTTGTCFDTTHVVPVSQAIAYTFKVTSAGGTLTAGPTYASGASACTNGTQVVTFTNGTSGINPVNATGTITVTANVPVGAVTLTSAGGGYTTATPPTQGTVATCTGTAAFTGGTVTPDTLSGVMITYQIY